jgi:hypothetical protein
MMQALKLCDTEGAIKVLNAQSGHAQVASKAALNAIQDAPAGQESGKASMGQPVEKTHTVVLRASTVVLHVVDSATARIKAACSASIFGRLQGKTLDS